MTGLDILLEGLFDYAGTSPPASLDLEAALRESSRFPDVLHRPKIVGADMVIGVDQLPRLDSRTLARCGFPPNRALRLCALSSPDTAANAAEAVARFNSDGKDVGRSVRSVELRLDQKTQKNPPAIHQLLSRIRSRLPEALTVFVEPTLSPGDGEIVAEMLADTLAAFNQRGTGMAGIKLRCIGSNPIPAKALAAAALHSGRARLPFKAVLAPTLPLAEPERAAELPGFLNLAAAIVLSRALGPEFPAERLAACLLSSRPALFGFGAGLRWGGFSLSQEQFEKAYAAAPLAFVTGDMREPDVGLRKMFP